jgi:membrane fusion protein (multidrug efflux system)
VADRLPRVAVATPASTPPAPRKWLRRVLLASGVLLAGVAASVYYFAEIAPYESTDDAFIDGVVISMAPQVAGQVVSLSVHDNQAVKQGDVLLEIDPRSYQVKLAEAQAELAAAQSRLDQAKAQFAVDQAKADQEQAVAKNRALAATAQVSLSETDIKTAEANVQLAEATVNQAALDLSYTKVTAPQAGLVTHRSVEMGNYVQPGQPLLALVPQQIWVVANFKETQLANMRPGEPVEITVDAYPDHKFHGHVDSIQAGSGAHFSLLPPENATGNYVKVVQRVPVKIVFDDPLDPAHPLGPGMSIVPVVKVK